MLHWTLVPSTYALCVGLVISALSGWRGLVPLGPPANVLLYVANIVGVLAALLVGALLVRGATTARARRARGRR